jgi:hypothetical protein
MVMRRDAQELQFPESLRKFAQRCAAFLSDGVAS